MSKQMTKVWEHDNVGPRLALQGLRRGETPRSGVSFGEALATMLAFKS